MPINDDDMYLEAITLTDKENMNTNRLKHAATTSALLAGFSMEAYVQMELDESLPDWLLILFAVNTTSLITVNLFALLTSVCLLPTISSYNIVVLRRAKLEGKTTPREHSPHLRFHYYIVTAWLASTVIGIEFFLFEVIVVSWVHFYVQCKTAAICVTVIMIPAMILFAIFAKHLHQGVIDMHLAPLKNVLDRGMEETTLLLPPELPQDVFYGTSVDGFDQFYDADDDNQRVRRLNTPSSASMLLRGARLSSGQSSAYSDTREVLSSNSSSQREAAATASQQPIQSQSLKKEELLIETEDMDTNINTPTEMQPPKPKE